MKIIPAIAAVVIVLLGLSAYFQHTGIISGRSILVSGNIEATDVRVSFQVSGKIREMLVDEGMFVKKDQLLSRLDKDELKKTREHASAALEEARFNYDLMKKDYERAENLFGSGAMTAQQRDAAKTGFDVADAKLKAAKSSLDLADIRLGYADLLSPVDGFVLVKSAELGEVIQQGSPVFTVADLTNIWLTAYINEKDLGRVKLNQQVDIKTDIYPPKIYKGRISFISQEAEFTPKQPKCPKSGAIL